jgi:hypothetical protein
MKRSDLLPQDVTLLYVDTLHKTLQVPYSWVKLNKQGKMATILMGRKRRFYSHNLIYLKRGSPRSPIYFSSLLD